MLSQDSLDELNKAFDQNPKGFLVIDSGKPKFAVIDYDDFQKIQSEPSNKKNDSEAKKVLVTGGAGYIGSHTVRMMEKQGYEIVVYDNLSTGRADNVKNSELVVADLADKEKLDQVFAEGNFDAVIHFAASIEVEESVKDPAKYFQNNVVNSINLINAMLSHGVKKLIFSSTCAVYGNADQLPITEQTPFKPESPYGLSKMIFEQVMNWYAKVYNFQCISLRYFNAAGAWPEENLGYEPEGNSLLIPKVLEVAKGDDKEIKVFGQNYPTADGTCVRDYVHVLDLADAHIKALQKIDSLNQFAVYNIGTGRGNTVLEVIDEAVEVTGRMVPMSVTERRPGDPVKLWADNSRAVNQLGWKPEKDLSDIIKSSWRWVNN